MLQSLLTIHSTDEDVQRRGRMLAMIVMGLLVMSLIALPIFLLVPGITENPLPTIVAIPLFAGLLWVAKQGYVGFGGSVMVLVLLALGAQTMVVEGVDRWPPLAVTVLIAGLTLEKKYIWPSALLSAGLIAFIASRAGPDGLSQATIPIILLLVFATLVYLGASSTQTTLEAARAARAEAQRLAEEARQASAHYQELATTARALETAEREANRRLGDTVAELQQAQHEAETRAAEALALQAAERDNRQQLEEVVAGYLTIIQFVAQGDLTQRIAVTQTGALGELGQGLNQMVASLQAITSQAQQASSAVLAAAAEILAATTQQASNAAEQSAALTQTAATIDEIKSIANQTTAQAGQVARESQAMLEAARHGASVVEETVGGMAAIRTRVESIAETILALSEQMQTIGTIIQTVNELADQSNLLALNAAIEAARAGEQGKSFAVVAQHVRDLAERSKAATGQVREILGEIQHATNRAVLVTEEGTKGVEVGVRLASQAGAVIQRIAGDVEAGARSNGEMSAAAQQQTVGIDQVSQALRSIQQATGQTLSSTRQAERAARDLNTLAQSLQRSLATYRLS